MYLVNVSTLWHEKNRLKVSRTPMQLGMVLVFRGKEVSRDHYLLVAFIGWSTVNGPPAYFLFPLFIHCISFLAPFRILLILRATLDEHSLYLVSFNVSIMCIFQIKWSFGLSGCLSICTPPKNIGVREQTLARASAIAR